MCGRDWSSDVCSSDLTCACPVTDAGTLLSRLASLSKHLLLVATSLHCISWLHEAPAEHLGMDVCQFGTDTCHLPMFPPILTSCVDAIRRRPHPVARPVSTSQTDLHIWECDVTADAPRHDGAGRCRAARRWPHCLPFWLFSTRRQA